MPPVMLPVPHVVQQRQGECLAACAAMLLTYLRKPVSYSHLLTLLRIQPEIGTPAYHIRNLRALGVTVTYQQGDLMDLHQHLQNDQPCLTPIKTKDFPHWPEETSHAVVVVGISNQAIYINDPAFATAPIRVPRGDFDLAWLAQGENYAVIRA